MSTKPRSSPVRIGLIQTSCSFNSAANLKKTLAAAERPPGRALKSSALRNYSAHNTFARPKITRASSLAEPIPGRTTEAFQAFARKHKVVVVASRFEKRAAGVYHNTAVIIDADGALLGKYRKMHIPDDPLFYEKFYFTPGDLGFRAWQTRYAKIGVLICWDQWYRKRRG